MPALRLKPGQRLLLAASAGGKAHNVRSSSHPRNRIASLFTWLAVRRPCWALQHGAQFNPQVDQIGRLGLRKAAIGFAQPFLR